MYKDSYTFYRNVPGTGWMLLDSEGFEGDGFSAESDEAALEQAVKEYSDRLSWDFPDDIDVDDDTIYYGDMKVVVSVERLD